MAAHLALNGVKVTLWNRTLENIADVVNDKHIYCNGIVNGKAIIDKASNRIEDVISDFVMVTTPSSAHRDIAQMISPFVHRNMTIILNPGRTFGAIDFKLALQECGVKELPHIAETQTIVYTCRKNSPNSVTIFALKDDVKIAALKNSNLNYIMKKMPECIKSHFTPTHSVALTSFSNVGMVLHCSPVLMNIGWIEADKSNFKYYYDGISKNISRFLEKIDIERINVANAAGYEVESVVNWLKRTYKVCGNGLYECIQNNEAYNKIDAPTNIYCRYIFEDVPNGLVPIEFIGKELGIVTHNISTIINLANSVFDIDFRKIGREISLNVIKNEF
ncbi:MAG: NAD/NADP octopine/nopaline dehydrogenase family protein [Ruminococcus sp.]|nr:NAD/NADP octopine/nopaline dehydrogenase family protein [Ruminococcus sp.]